MKSINAKLVQMDARNAIQEALALSVVIPTIGNPMVNYRIQFHNYNIKQFTQIVLSLFQGVTHTVLQSILSTQIGSGLCGQCVDVFAIECTNAGKNSTKCSA